MIHIRIEGRSVHDMVLKPAETVAELITRFKEEKGVHFHGDSYILQDENTGRQLTADEIVPDDRLYYLTAWMVPA